MWIWHTEGLLSDKGRRESLFRFCKEKNIAELFLQLILSYCSSSIIEHPSKLRLFLREATSFGIRVHALDGHPSFALKKNHQKALGMINAVLEFNKNSAPSERFYGIHLDNEPYLLDGFKARKKEILASFLELKRLCAKEIRSNLAYGIDIPFWFKEVVGFNPIDICDNVGIMDYRNFAKGPGGIIECGLPYLEYADKKKKLIYIGVETLKLEDERKQEFSIIGAAKGEALSNISFAGKTEKQFEQELKEAEKEFLKHPSFGGFAIHHYESYRKLCGH
jgi:hypothetical protein